jgi:hypothetical protein
VNYLQLVNKAINLSGVELDDLTSSNFASTTDSLSKKFKTFVADAWKDIQLERDEWEFKSAQTFANVYPRLLIEDGDRPTAPPANAEYEGDTTTASIVVIDSTPLSGTWGTGTAEAWLDLDDLSISSIMLGETFDEIDPDPLNLNVFKVKDLGRYDLLGDISDAYEINKSSFSVQGLDTSDNLALKWISWAEYQRQILPGNGSFGTPRFITEAPDGTFQLFPHPNKGYRVSFEYTKAPQTFTDYDDTPTGLAVQYHDAIVYRAMKYYGDYDSQQAVWARGERGWRLMKTRMEKNLMPTPTWGVNIYDATRF